MISKKNQTELDRTLENQLARCLDEQLKRGDPVARENPLASTLDNLTIDNPSGLDDVIGLIEHAGQHLSAAKSKITQEKKVARKYVEMCALVKGLLGNFRKLTSDNEIKSKNIAKLQKALAEQNQQLLDSRQLIASLQEELLKSVSQADEDRQQMKVAKSQIAQLKQLLRITAANESADTDARISIEETQTAEARPIIDPVIPSVIDSELDDDVAGQKLLKQIDDMLAQIPVHEVPARKIAA